jgi:hypothetical protein
MKKIIDYCIICEYQDEYGQNYTDKYLYDLVNEMIMSGWQPFGSPFVMKGSCYSQRPCQAMVKYEEEN